MAAAAEVVLKEVLKTTLFQRQWAAHTQHESMELYQCFRLLVV